MALVLANAVFAGAEIAILNVRKTRLSQLVEERRGGARAVAALRRAPERFLATVQIGITVVGASAAAFGGTRLSGPLADALTGAGVPYAHDFAFALVVALVSYLSLVLGELVPKSLALRFSERYALLVAPPLHGLSRMALPLVWFLTASSNLILRLFGDRTTFTESRLAPEELQQLVQEAARTGSLDQRVAEIASRAFDSFSISSRLARDALAPAPRALLAGWVVGTPLRQRAGSTGRANRARALFTNASLATRRNCAPQGGFSVRSRSRPSGASSNAAIRTTVSLASDARPAGTSTFWLSLAKPGTSARAATRSESFSTVSG